MAAQGGSTLPGYTGLTGGSACTRAAEAMTMERQTGAFLVRSRSSVYQIKDGYLVRGSDGRIMGSEEADFDSAFLAPPPIWTDSVASQTEGREGVAYNQQVVTFDNSPATLTSASLYFGAPYDGLTLNFSDLTNIRLSGTPALFSPGWAYFELKLRWSNHKSVIQRYAMRVLPA